MSPEVLGALALLITAASGLFVGLRNSGVGKTSASASEVSALGARLDAAHARIDGLEVAMAVSRTREDALINYGYDTRRILTDAGITPPPWPEGLP